MANPFHASPGSDRFQTFWTGPFHVSALAYAAQHSISYDRDGGVVLALAPGIYILHGGSGGTDVSKLRRANRQADEETRARFARDTDVHTGTSRHPEEGWWKATRGEKLRSSGDHRGMYGVYWR
jgi:hypothetical protein